MDVFSSDILLSAPRTPLHKCDNTQDYGKRNGGEKKIQRAKAPPSEQRHFLLGYPPLVTSEGERRDGGKEKVNVKLAESIRACPPEGWGGSKLQ